MLYFIQSNLTEDGCSIPVCYVSSPLTVDTVDVHWPRLFLLSHSDPHPDRLFTHLPTVEFFCLFVACMHILTCLFDPVLFTWVILWHPSCKPSCRLFAVIFSQRPKGHLKEKARTIRLRQPPLFGRLLVCVVFFTSSSLMLLINRTALSNSQIICAVMWY